MEKLIATNPVAKRDYLIEEIVEAGLVLTGTEVKSIRNQAPNLRDSFVEIQSSGKRFEAYLVNTHIDPYSHGNIYNHLSLRRRKLLLHFKQLEKMYGSVIQKGMSVIPTKMYFKKGLVKVELGLARGRKNYDKRDNLKEKAARRDLRNDQE